VHWVTLGLGLRDNQISKVDELKLMPSCSSSLLGELMDNYVKSSSDVVVQSYCVLESNSKNASHVASGNWD